VKNFASDISSMCERQCRTESGAKQFRLRGAEIFSAWNTLVILSRSEAQGSTSPGLVVCSQHDKLLLRLSPFPRASLGTAPEWSSLSMW
jgi:hypothetical protein